MHRECSTCKLTCILMGNTTSRALLHLFPVVGCHFHVFGQPISQKPITTQKHLFHTKNQFHYFSQSFLKFGEIDYILDTIINSEKWKKKAHFLHFLGKFWFLGSFFLTLEFYKGKFTHYTGFHNNQKSLPVALNLSIVKRRPPYSQAVEAHMEISVGVSA